MSKPIQELFKRESLFKAILILVKLSIVMLYRNSKWAFYLLFNRGDFLAKVHDFRMFVNFKGLGLDLSERSITKQLVMDAGREPEATKYMRSFISENDVILELGANIGYYVVLESRLLSPTKGYIYAVEPAPENLRLLQKNIDYNQIRNIHVDGIALGSSTGTSKLYLSSASNLHSLADDGVSSNFITVQVKAVDEYLKGKKPVTFIRMDIEGFEVEVINSMKNILGSSKFKKLFVEIHPQITGVPKMKKFLGTLKKHGFEVEHVVCHDKYLSGIIGSRVVTKMSIEKLQNSPDFISGNSAFEVFFRRK